MRKTLKRICFPGICCFDNPALRCQHGVRNFDV